MYIDLKYPKNINKILYKYLYPFLIKRKKGLIILGEIKISGWPVIDIRNGASVTIDNNVTLNSSNYGYHINMHSPVKIFADEKDAEIYIGKNTRIHGACIHASEKISIGNNCLIAANCQIFDRSGHNLSFDNVMNRINTRGDSMPVQIENYVWIGLNTIILPGVRIGEGSIIGAGSVVVGDIPPFVIAAGNPAKVIRQKT